MGKKYDARKMTDLCDTLDHVVERYTAHAEMLENEYEKYNSNNTYKGEAADASKEFVYRGQGKLTKEQVRVLNRLSKKFKETQEYFSSSVDSSPNAKIDTDVIEYDKRYLERQKESFEEKAWQMERVTREMADKFERFGFLTRVNADRARYGFEDMCGYNGFMNKCLRKFEEFDAEMTAHLKQTGLDRYMYDLETDTKATMNALDGMTVYKPDVKKITVTPIAQMASKMMYSAGLIAGPSKENVGNSNIEVKKLAELLNVKCSLDTVVSKSVITKAAELAILDCKTDNDKIVIQNCAASMIAPGADIQTMENILQEFSEALGPYGVYIKFILTIICITAFLVENAEDIKRSIEKFVTPKEKEDNSIIIENPPKEDKKTIIEGPTAVPQEPSVTDIPSGDVEEKEIGRDIMPTPPIEDDGPKITTIEGSETEKDYSNSRYGESVEASEEKMYQQGKHYNKHGREMGYPSKKAYEQGARDFLEQNRDEAEIYEGTWNDSRGSQAGERQIIIRKDGKQLIINKETQQIIDFYEGTDLSGFKDLERVQ